MGATLILLHSTTTVHGASAGNFSLAMPNCQEKCGNLTIPYPFGIGKDNCFLTKDFEVVCDENNRALISTGEEQYMQFGSNMTNSSEILDFDLLNGEVRIQSSIYWRCNYNIYSNAHNNVESESNFVLVSLGNSLKFSYTKNKFTAIGCATLATIVGSKIAHEDGNNWHYTTTCASFCDSVAGISNSAECDSMGCCQTPLPANLSAFRFNILQEDRLLYNPYAQSFSPCSYVSVVEADSFKFDPSDAQGTNFMKQSSFPLVLDWSVGTETCAEAKKNSSSFACRALNSVCINATNGSGYRCNCSPGYQGNPYLGFV